MKNSLFQLSSDVVQETIAILKECTEGGDKTVRAILEYQNR